MGVLSKIKRGATETDKADYFLKSRMNELLLLLKNKRFGAIASYFISGFLGRSIYNKYLYFIADQLKVSIILTKVRNYEMLIDIYDVGLSKQLYLYGTREDKPASIFEEEIRKIKQEVERPLIVEAGANIGYYTILEANAAKRDCGIVAIEPSESNISLLERNINLNGISDIVSISRCAIGSETGEATLQLADRSNLHRIDDDRSRNHDTGSESVLIWSLDEFLNEHNHDPNDVNVIRMDIEGHELNALDGMDNVLHSKGPVLIYLEVHNNLLSDADAREIPRRLSNAGFELRAVEYDTITSSPFDLTYDADDWESLQEIDAAYSLIAKK